MSMDFTAVVVTFISLEVGLAGEDGFLLLMTWRVCFGVVASSGGLLAEISASLGNFATGSLDDSDGSCGSEECFLFLSEAAQVLAAGLEGAMVKNDGRK